MNVGDLVKCDSWVHRGVAGVIIRIQDVSHCTGAYVLLDVGLKLIRLDNLTLLKENEP